MNNDSFVLTRTDDTGRFFNRINVGDISISIQASSFHYCEPKIDSMNSYNYTSFEVALMDSETLNFVNPKNDDRFKGFEWADNWSDYDDVVGYIDRSIVQQIIDDVCLALGSKID